MKSDSSDDDKEGGEEGGDGYSDSMRSLFADEETGGVGGIWTYRVWFWRVLTV